MTGLLQFIDDVAPDKPRAASDENIHGHDPS
jgi:hypothetical protein